MSNKCTPLWSEAHLPMKKVKTPYVQSTIQSCDVEKVHTVVARSTFRSQNVQNTSASDHFLGVEMSKKCTPLWREAHFEVKSAKNWRVRSTFGRSDVVSRGRRTGLCTLSKVSKTWRFCSISKNDGRRGTFEEDLQRCIFRGRRNTSDLQVCWDDFAWQVQHFVWPGITFSCRRNSLDRWSRKIAKRIARGRQLCTQISIFEGCLAELLHFWCCQL